jgi:hypothetical protein
MIQQTPVLGIHNDVEAPHERMVVVVFGKAPKLRWAYVMPMAGRAAGDHPYQAPDLFTSLKTFGIEATLVPDGRLALHQINISTATYPDGSARRWQGSASTAIDVCPHAAGFVMRAVNLDFESRRAKRESESQSVA